MPVLFGALLGFLLGGVVGNATFGPHGGLVGCTIGVLLGGGIMTALRSSWARQEVKRRPTAQAEEDLEDEFEEDQKA